MSKKEDFTADSLLVDFNLSKYKMNPMRIKWDIDIGDRYGYKELKNTAKELYKIENYAESPEEKIKVKIASAAYILRGFDNLKKKIKEKHDEFVNKFEVKSLLESENPLISELENNFGIITRRYIEKVEVIQKAWYEDWKDFGEIEDYTPLSAKMYGVSIQERHRILDEAKAKYQLLYDHNEGDDENNPIKWWITNNIADKLESYKRQQPKEWGNAPNANEYTDSIVKTALQNYLDAIDKLPNDNLVQAYNHISKILNYLNRFADINSRVSFEQPLDFVERIRTINVRKGFEAETQYVKNIMLEIYNKMSAKYNSDNLADFVEFMQINESPDTKVPNYFSNFYTTTDILFELYFIRKSNTKNNNNFNINNVAEMYRTWKTSGKKLAWYLPPVDMSSIIETGRWVSGKYDNLLQHFARADGSENPIAQIKTWYTNRQEAKKKAEEEKKPEEKKEEPKPKIDNSTKPPSRSVQKRQNKKK